MPHDDEILVRAADLRKSYGEHEAVRGVDFEIRRGEAFGFLGANGAGKSTTMRILLGLDAADAGTALVGGVGYRTLREPLRRVGALLDATAVHPGRRGRDHLLWLAHSNGIPTRRVDEVLSQVGMEQAGRRRAGGYSLGMLQRLGIAAALLGDPETLALRELHSGRPRSRTRAQSRIGRPPGFVYGATQAPRSRPRFLISIPGSFGEIS